MSYYPEYPPYQEPFWTSEKIVIVGAIIAIVMYVRSGASSTSLLSMLSPATLLAPLLAPVTSLQPAAAVLSPVSAVGGLF